jgi:hypothetical protein
MMMPKLLIGLLFIVSIVESINNKIVWIWYKIIGEKKILNISCRNVNNKIKIDTKPLVKELNERKLTMNDILILSAKKNNLGDDFNGKDILIEIYYRVKNNYFKCMFWGTDINLPDIINRFNDHFYNEVSDNKRVTMGEIDVLTNLKTEEKIFSKKALNYINLFCENYEFEKRFNDFYIVDELTNIINSVFEKENKNNEIINVNEINNEKDDETDNETDNKISDETDNEINDESKNIIDNKKNKNSKNSKNKITIDNENDINKKLLKKHINILNKKVEKIIGLNIFLENSEMINIIF